MYEEPQHKGREGRKIDNRLSLWVSRGEEQNPSLPDSTRRIYRLRPPTDRDGGGARYATGRQHTTTEDLEAA